MCRSKGNIDEVDLDVLENQNDDSVIIANSQGYLSIPKSRIRY